LPNATAATASLRVDGDYRATLASELGIAEVAIDPYVPSN